MSNAVTEAGVVAELVAENTAPVEVDSSKLYFHNGQVVNLQDFQPTPRRKRGKVTHYTADSLAAYANDHREAGCAAYMDEEGFSITCVLNGPSPEGPGWSDHIAMLTMRQTPEWRLWEAADNRMMSQEAFARHVESGLMEIVKPASATMLELAQSFQATTNLSFKSGKWLQDGSRQLEYVEDVSATAGKTGTIAIPAELELAISPFEGSDRYKLRAFFRYRITNGVLELGYKLDRPRDAQKQAFVDVADAFQKATLLKTIYRGKPDVK